MTRIGEFAFAGTALAEAQFYSCPEIAETAFERVTANFAYMGEGWTEDDLVGYGGDITWQRLIRLGMVDDYQTEDLTSEGEMYIPEGEVFEYDAEAYCMDENYHFDHYEVAEGNLTIEDPRDPILTVVLTEDAMIRVVYAKNE